MLWGMGSRWSMSLVLAIIACGPSVGEGEGDGGGTTSSAMGSTGRPGVTSTTGGMGEVSTGGDSTGPRLDLPPDVGGPGCPTWPAMGCGTPTARTSVGGTTPLGDYATSYAVFGSDAGCGLCVWPNIVRFVLAADPTVLQDLEPWSEPDETLVLQFEFGGFEGPPGAELNVVAIASRGGSSVQTFDGLITIDGVPTEEELAGPFDPMSAVVITGSVSVVGDGWDVSGPFSAVYCPDANQYAICE